MRQGKRAAINNNNNSSSSSREEDSSSQECQQGFQLLPEPLVMEILLRLMAKTLLICMCVCKSWLSIISDPQFSQMHISRSHLGLLIKKRTTPQTRRLRLIEFTQFEQCCESGNASSPFQLERLRFKPNTSLPPKMSATFELCNSCNGLLLLWSKFKDRDETLDVCNPIFGDYITLPPTNKQITEYNLFCILGYSDITNEYKVLKSDQSDGEAQIYTIGTGVWRSIGKAPQLATFRKSFNTVLHGNFHWLSDRRTIGSIHAFSFETEQFNTLQIPPSIEKEENLNLGVFEGCLLLCVFDNFHATRFGMWVMNDYGVQESWTKTYVVEGGLKEPCFPNVYEPVVFLRYGDIMFSYNDLIVVSYNQETKMLKEETRVAETQCSHLICYNPCFFSLHHVAQGEEVKRVGVKKKFKKPFGEGSSSSAGSTGVGCICYKQ